MERGTAKRGNIRRYPRSLNLNIGMIIFLIIAVYLIVSLWNYFHSKHIAGYEVREGTITTGSVYDAIALRDEHLVGSAKAGYVNYFAPEGARVGFGNLVYTIDETGGLLELMQSEGAESVSFSTDDYREIRSQIVDFSSVFDPSNFHSVYDFSTTLEQTAQKITNANVLSDMESLSGQGSRAGTIGYYSAPASGIVVFSRDGMEEYTAYDIKAEDFDEGAYSREHLLGNSLVAEGDPVYKLIENENWQLVIHPDGEQLETLRDAGYVRVRFLKNQYEAWGYASVVEAAGGDTFVTLDFSNSMVSFCTDRHLRIQIDTETKKGLKIPQSALVEKTFFLIPNEFITTGAEGVKGVLRKVWLEDGSESAEFITTEVYNVTDTETYVSESDLAAGDQLIKPESTDVFTVSATDSMNGVYNINKGYADFRRVNYLYGNEEYAIVESGTQYGLNVYDYIVLDSSTVVENELIYE